MRIVGKALAVRPSHFFWPILIILGAVSSIAIFSTIRQLQLSVASARSHQSILELGGFVSDLKDVETGVRGYALTRDRRFLEPYHQGNKQLSTRIDRLQELAKTERELAGRVLALRPFAERRTGLAAKVVDEVSRGRENGDLRQLLLESKSSMDELRREVATTDTALRAAHGERQRTVSRQAVAASASLAIGVATSVAVLIWLFSLLNREVGRRREIEGELRELNAVLEQRVQEGTRQIEETRQLLNAVIENMPDPLFLKDAANEFRYVMVNRAGAELLGRDPTSLIGCVDRDVFPEKEAALAHMEDANLVGAPPNPLVSVRLVTTARGERSLELRKCLIEIDDTSRKFVLGLVRDLTEWKRLETQVREMQRLDAIGRLTGGVAHDFNNLLAVIVGSVELVREKLPDESEMATFADEAINAALRGADLVRRLLAFARKQHLDPVAVDLNERLPTIVPLLQRTLGETIQLQVKEANKLWPARIDPTQFDDALVNMAINARDAMPAGGKLTIETANVELDEDYAAHHMEVEAGDYVMLVVSDTGTGMDADVIERVFEPFFTTKEEGKGTGLGLSQVFGWVKQSGGHIKIYSELGHGTTIKLYLPRAVEEAEAARAPRTEEPKTRGHETILVVEDNPNVRRTVKRQLTDLGYSVLEAEDGESALALIRAGEQFDLMLTDVVMPGGMGGHELAAEAEKVRRSIRVIFTSGYTELAMDGLQAARKGPLLSKPYTKRDLGRAIRSALDSGESDPS